MPAHTSTPYPHADTTDNDITITPAGGISLVVNEETSDEYNDDTVPIGNDVDTGRNNNDHCAYFFSEFWHLLWRNT